MTNRSLGNGNASGKDGASNVAHSPPQPRRPKRIRFVNSTGSGGQPQVNQASTGGSPASSPMTPMTTRSLGNRTASGKDGAPDSAHSPPQPRPKRIRVATSTGSGGQRQIGKTSPRQGAAPLSSPTPSIQPLTWVIAKRGMNSPRKIASHSSPPQPARQQRDVASATVADATTTGSVSTKPAVSSQRSTAANVSNDHVRRSPNPVTAQGFIKKRSQSRHRRCIHQKRQNLCKTCKGAALCVHFRQKLHCRDCRPHSSKAYCEHGKQKSRCSQCGGSGICEHGREKYRCKECREESRE